MPEDIETQMVEHMRPLFGEFAATALEQQKAKLGLAGAVAAADYLRLAEEIRAMCREIAGPAVAERVYSGLLAILQEAA